MTPITHPESTTLRAALDDIILTHGRWRVLVALALRSLRRGPPLRPLALNNHLRRDIGLPPLEDETPGWSELR
jgi:hypothetical protein